MAYLNRNNKNNLSWLKAFLVVILVFSCYISCNRIPKSVRQSLKLAGENSSELEAVINKYQAPENSIKLKSAYFLIGNMKGHVSFDTTNIYKYRKLWLIRDSLNAVDLTKREQTKKLNDIWKSITSKAFIQQNVYNDDFVRDLENLNADFLVETINKANLVRTQNPYIDSISNKDFFEYILPYRTRNGEYPEQWRTFFINRHFVWVKDNYPMPITQVFDSILYQYKNYKYSWDITNYPYVKNSDFMRSKQGLCIEKCHFNAKIFTSLGFPVSTDFVPVWGNRNNSHAWNSLIYGNKSYAFESFWDQERWKYKRIYDNVNADKKRGQYKLPKVFRQTFVSHIVGPLSDKRVDYSNIPKLFLNVRKKDVSNEYFKTIDIVEKVNKIPKNTYYIYLCVFNNNRWEPVQWGKIENGQTVFKQMGMGIVYLKAFFKQGQVIPVGNPFILYSNGQKEVLTPTKEKQAIVLNRKYPMFSVIEFDKIQESKLWIGTEIFASNDPDFSNQKMIHKINKAPHWDHISENVETSLGFRYFRFSINSIALNKTLELNFNSTNNAAFKPIRFDSKGGDKDELRNIFDNDLNTKYQNHLIKESKLVSAIEIKLDFGQPIVIDNINIVRLYDNNYIFPNTTYELFYWNNQWVSLGEKVPSSTKLNYTNVPKNSLLRFVRNIPSHKRSRIFTYENGKQIWW
ncbi:MAG: transglutaminase domain-containing protein [Bacteroidetes bacterium]|nr:transglutaminase domain-containing protein [Bacteroidota bacterium]